MRRNLFTIVLLMCCFFKGAADPTTDSLSSLVKQYVKKDLDSLWSLTEELRSLAIELDDDTLGAWARIRQVESLLHFNFRSKADSVISDLSIQKSKSYFWVDYTFYKGQIFRFAKENDAALQSYYDAISVAREISYLPIIPEIYFEIALVLRQNQDVENTRKYLDYALQESERQGLTALQIKTYIRLCMMYNGWMLLDLDSSVYFGEQAIDLALSTEDERGYADAISFAAAPIIRNGQSRRGLMMSKEALSYADKYNFPLQTRLYLTGNQAFAYLDLNVFDSALYYQQKAMNLRPEALDMYRLKYQILKAMGDYPEALKQHEVYVRKLDSTLRVRNKSALSSLQARLESNLKEQELATLTEKTQVQRLQLSQQRYFFAGVILLVIIAGAGVFMFYRQRQLNRQQSLTRKELLETQKRLELEQQYRASELKAIRSQMNPHFVFNALNSIQEYIMSNERKLAGKYLGKFADLMRIYLEHSQVKSISLREEIEALELYLELEKLRFEESFSYQVNIDGDVDLECAIPSLLLQPYIENAIKHGLLHKETDRSLILDLRGDAKSDVLICTVEDNGIGRKRSNEINAMRNPNHKSFATKAAKSRLELLNHDRDYPITEETEDLYDDHGASAGTRVTLVIPFSQVSEDQGYDSEVNS